MNTQPETRYARNGPMHLAYQVLGSGPPNLVVVQSEPNSHVDHNWTESSLARFIRPLASFSRLAGSNSCEMYADNVHYVK